MNTGACGKNAIRTATAARMISVRAKASGWARSSRCMADIRTRGDTPGHHTEADSGPARQGPGTRASRPRVFDRADPWWKRADRGVRAPMGALIWRHVLCPKTWHGRGEVVR